MKPLQSIDAGATAEPSRDPSRPLLWAGSTAATLTALQAAAAPQGGGVICPSIGCVKWWTQVGDLTADIKGEIGSGYVETTAAIAQQLVLAASGPAFAAGNCCDGDHGATGTGRLGDQG